MRDLGHNNIIKRQHLVVSEIDNIYNNCEVQVIEELQKKIIDKIEHKLDRCEKFLDNNQDCISLSYYSEGYYNGRARAFEDVLDIIKENLENV